MSFILICEDKFLFGFWMIGYNGIDLFGGLICLVFDVVYVVEKLVEFGVYGFIFYDDDLFVFGLMDVECQIQIDWFKGVFVDMGFVVLMVIINLFSVLVFKDGGFILNDCQVWCYVLCKVFWQFDFGVEFGVKIFVMWGGCEGVEYDLVKDVCVVFEWYCEVVNLFGDYVIDKGYDIWFVIELKLNEFCGDILLFIFGYVIVFIDLFEWLEFVGVNFEVGYEQMVGFNFIVGIVQVLYYGKFFYIDFNGQCGIKYDQDLVFGYGDLYNVFLFVDLFENGGFLIGLGIQLILVYDGFCYFDYKFLCIEDEMGVWELVVVNMCIYLLLKECVVVFCVDFEVQEVLVVVKVVEFLMLMLDEGEGYEVFFVDCSVYEDFDVDVYFGGKGFGFVWLQQFVIEYLFGVC